VTEMGFEFINREEDLGDEGGAAGKDVVQPRPPRRCVLSLLRQRDLRVVERRAVRKGVVKEDRRSYLALRLESGAMPTSHSHPKRPARVSMRA
jgi:hypothetical protein